MKAVSCGLAAFAFALCAVAGENLLRDDFTPDNIGGVIGWSANGSSLLKMKFTRLESEKPGEQGGVRITWWNHRILSLRSTLRMPLVKVSKPLYNKISSLYDEFNA